MTFKKLESFLKMKDKNNNLSGLTLPPIRFFDGNQTFSDVHGKYKANSLEESLSLYIKSHEIPKNKN